jgi:hypothetical protein
MSGRSVHNPQLPSSVVFRFWGTDFEASLIVAPKLSDFDVIVEFADGAILATGPVPE